MEKRRCRTAGDVVAEESEDIDKDRKTE